jgi:sigma-B regulation protein RsbU (phosphoserine phosphatase)
VVILCKKILSTEKDISSLRNKLNDALIILTDDEMFSTQKASILSSTLKRRLNTHAEILCTISIGTNDTYQNRLEIDSFSIEPSYGSDEKTYTLIEKTSYVHAFAVNEIDNAKKVFDVKTVNELLSDIQLKNTELEQSLHNLRIAKDQNARMESELEVGKSIQTSMLPKEEYKSDSIDLYAKLIPAREVGGDFYDFFEVDSGRLGMVMGDVSGKGVPAALMMAVTKTLLKSRAVNDKSTASILTHVNNEIAKENDAYMFITVFMAILDTDTGELTYSSAGHNPSYIINKESRKIKKLSDLHGPVVGAMEGMAYGETKLFLKKNDIVFSYTDGVTESHNSDAELYSDPRLEGLLENGEYDSAKSLTDLIIGSVKEFEGDADQFDDVTVMSIEYCQKPKRVSSIESSIIIVNDLKQITKALEWFEAFAIENKIPFATIQKINIVLDELLNNIISYGYNDEDEHEIEIEVELRGERLILIISDDGIPFNPFKNEPVDIMVSVEEREIGGLGVHLVKTLMDEYEYNRQIDKNIITLIKQNISA